VTSGFAARAGPGAEQQIGGADAEQRGHDQNQPDRNDSQAPIAQGGGKVGEDERADGQDAAEEEPDDTVKRADIVLARGAFYCTGTITFIFSKISR